MPEVAEVKLCADTILPLVENRIVINAFPTDNGRYTHENLVGYKDFLNNITNNIVRIKNIQTKGKFMWFEFDNGYYMFSTFGMSGMWASKREKHPCFIFSYIADNKLDFCSNDAPHELIFNDPRHFGTIRFTNNKQELLDKLHGLGWDPLSEDLTPSVIINIKNYFAKTNKTISQVLMDQSIFAGVGNYIKCESLYIAHISPWRPCNLLSDYDIDALLTAIVMIAQTSYQNNGASIHTYKDANGNRGNYTDHFKVYGRKIDPLGNLIIRQTTADKRTTHWCPKVQQ